MTKAAFIHDHNFVFDKNRNLYFDGSGGVFNYELWNRYLAVFDSLLVIGRKKENLPNKLVVSSHTNVSFFLISELRSGLDRFLKATDIRRKLESQLASCDTAIIRVPSTLGYLAVDICQKHSIPYVLEIVGCPWDAYWNYGSLAAKIIAPFEMYKLKMLAKRSPYVIYVTKHFLQKRYPSRGRTQSISNVNIHNLIPTTDISSFYQNDFFDDFKIGMIGSFHVKYKGHIEILRSIKKLVHECGLKNIKLLLVGTGDYSWIRDIIVEYDLVNNVTIIGTLEAGNAGIIPFLDSVHLYVHPSKQEGLPRVIIEAMSRGRMCLASSVAGTPELLSQRFLHAPGDWKTMASQIEQLIKTGSEERIEIASTNLNKAREYLEPTLQARRYEFLMKIMHAHEPD